MNSILPVNLTDSEEKKAGGWDRRANRNIFSGWAGSERHSSTSCSEWCRVLIRWATCEVIQRKICSVSTRLPLYSLSMTLPFDAEVWGTDMIRVERCQPRLMHDLADRRQPTVIHSTACGQNKSSSWPSWWHSESLLLDNISNWRWANTADFTLSAGRKPVSQHTIGPNPSVPMSTTTLRHVLLQYRTHVSWLSTCEHLIVLHSCSQTAVLWRNSCFRCVRFCLDSVSSLYE